MGVNSECRLTRIVHRWVERAGLDSSAYDTHSLRRTKAAQIYRKTGNLRAVQLLLGHPKLEPEFAVDGQIWAGRGEASG